MKKISFILLLFFALSPAFSYDDLRNADILLDVLNRGEGVERIVESKPGDADPLEWILLAAETAEMAGKYSTAMDLFLYAAESATNKDLQVMLQLDAAEMAMTMGEFTRTEELILPLLERDIAEEEIERAILVLARIGIFNDDNSGLKKIEKALRVDDKADYLYWMSLVKEDSGFLDKLLSAFPGAPETKLALDEFKKLLNPLNLGVLFSEHDIIDEDTNTLSVEDPQPAADPEPPVPESTESTERSESLSGRIQTGSFVRMDNAEDLRKTLSAMGYQVEIIDAERGGTLYHRVIIKNLPQDRLGEELGKLKNQGFDGFITR